jgi:hypothetical protein
MSTSSTTPPPIPSRPASAPSRWTFRALDAAALLVLAYSLYFLFRAFQSWRTGTFDAPGGSSRQRLWIGAGFAVLCVTMLATRRGHRWRIIGALAVLAALAFIFIAVRI